MSCLEDRSDTVRKARVLIVFGTRPEAIKLAAVIEAFGADPRFELRIVATAQHRDLLDRAIETFEIRPDHDLDLMRPDQSLAKLTAGAMCELSAILEIEAPDLVLVQGDTTTAMVGALAAFYRDVPVAHVEAGLRSLDKRNPFPEEINRQIVTRIADLHFAPTERNRSTLIHEGVPESSIIVTGNPGIDALLKVARLVDESRVEVLFPGLRAKGRRLVLVTLHRRESFGEPLARICSALKQVVREHPDIEILYPVHPNPNVRGPVHSVLQGEPRVRLVEPLGYEDFVCAMRIAHLIVTDSGGVQEEAPSLGTPVLVLRDVTERVEAVEIGAARLVGRDPDDLRAAIGQLLRDEPARRRMTGHANPYGDGRAAERMVRAVATFLGLSEPTEARPGAAVSGGAGPSGGVATASWTPARDGQ